MCVSLSAMASETSVKNAEGVDIWYDFDSSTTTASVTYRGSDEYSYNNEYTGEVVIPSTVTYEGEEYSVTSIGYSAFDGCSSLTSISLPEGLTSIGDYAFYSCSALTSITLPEGLTSIGNSAFRSCVSLTSITLPKGVTEIEEWTFAFCDALTSITLPEGLTSIGDDAFEGCSALTSIALPEGVTSIGDAAFYDCKVLTSITIPEGVTSIGNYAFAYCPSLTSITLPEGVTSIGENAFCSCVALTSITSKNATPPTIGGSDTFYDVGKSIPVYVPKSSVDAYKSAEYWKDFTNIVGKYYIVDIEAENGTVEGAGAYEENAEATLTATPAEGYKFVQWSDGVTNNPRTMTITKDVSLEAIFEKETSTAIENDNVDAVSVRLIGNRVVVEGADDYTVYSISGQNLGKAESVERGIYIVVVNGKSYKVVAK